MQLHAVCAGVFIRPSAARHLGSLPESLQTHPGDRAESGPGKALPKELTFSGQKHEDECSEAESGRPLLRGSGMVFLELSAAQDGSCNRDFAYQLCLLKMTLSPSHRGKKRKEKVPPSTLIGLLPRRRGRTGPNRDVSHPVPIQLKDPLKSSADGSFFVMNRCVNFGAQL